MKKILSIFLVVFFIFLFSFSSFALSDNQVHLSESLSDVIYIPPLPACYDDYSHNIYFYDTVTECYYIVFAQSPIKWLNYYNALMDEYFYKHSLYSRMVFYRFNPADFPFKWVLIPDSEYHGFYGGFNIPSSFVLLHTSSPIYNINGGGVFFDYEADMNINWFFVTISLGRFQRFFLNNLNVIVPICVLVLCSFVFERFFKRLNRKKKYYINRKMRGGFNKWLKKSVR